MKQIKELPPGTMFTWCVHLMMDSPDISKDLMIGETIIWLNEIPNEVGYHGTCGTCGSRYFSRPDGVF